MLVDFINPLDFPTAAALARRALPAARATRGLLDLFRRRQGLTVFANDNFQSWERSFVDLVQRCRERGGAPAGLVEALAPDPRDVALLKPRHSAFYGTALEFILQEQQVRTVVLAGVSADSCVTFTALDAFVRGYQLWVPRDCIAGESAAVERSACEHLERVAKAVTVPVGVGLDAALAAAQRRYR